MVQLKTLKRESGKLIEENSGQKDESQLFQSSKREVSGSPIGRYPFRSAWKLLQSLTTSPLAHDVLSSTLRYGPYSSTSGF